MEIINENQKLRPNFRRTGSVIRKTKLGTTAIITFHERFETF
jgi:hypothetical protein